MGSLKELQNLIYAVTSFHLTFHRRKSLSDVGVLFLRKKRGTGDQRLLESSVFILSVTIQKGVQGDSSPLAGVRGVPAQFLPFVKAAVGGTKKVPEQLLLFTLDKKIAICYITYS